MATPALGASALQMFSTGARQRLPAPPRHRVQTPVPRRPPPARPPTHRVPHSATPTPDGTPPMPAKTTFLTSALTGTTIPTSKQPAPASASPTGSTLISRTSPSKKTPTAGPVPLQRTVPPSTNTSHTGTCNCAQPHLRRVRRTLALARHAHTRTHGQSLTHNTLRRCTPARHTPRATPPHPRPPQRQTPINMAGDPTTTAT